MMIPSMLSPLDWNYTLSQKDPVIHIEGGPLNRSSTDLVGRFFVAPNISDLHQLCLSFHDLPHGDVSGMALFQKAVVTLPDSSNSRSTRLTLS